MNPLTEIFPFISTAANVIATGVAGKARTEIPDLPGNSDNQLCSKITINNYKNNNKERTSRKKPSCSSSNSVSEEETDDEFSEAQLVTDEEEDKKQPNYSLKLKNIGEENASKLNIVVNRHRQSETPEMILAANAVAPIQQDQPLDLTVKTPLSNSTETETETSIGIGPNNCNKVSAPSWFPLMGTPGFLPTPTSTPTLTTEVKPETLSSVALNNLPILQQYLPFLMMNCMMLKAAISQTSPTKVITPPSLPSMKSEISVSLPSIVPPITTPPVTPIGKLPAFPSIAGIPSHSSAVQSMFSYAMPHETVSPDVKVNQANNTSSSPSKRKRRSNHSSRHSLIDQTDASPPSSLSPPEFPPIKRRSHEPAMSGMPAMPALPTLHASSPVASVASVTGSTSSNSTTTSNRSFQCNQCSSLQPSLALLSQHTKEVHGKYRCHVCDKTFTQRSNLQRHAMCHLGFKPFQCRICSKEYNRKDHMIRHMETNHPNLLEDEKRQREPDQSLSAQSSSVQLATCNSHNLTNSISNSNSNSNSLDGIDDAFVEQSLCVDESRASESLASLTSLTGLTGLTAPSATHVTPNKCADAVNTRGDTTGTEQQKQHATHSINSSDETTTSITSPPSVQPRCRAPPVNFTTASIKKYINQRLASSQSLNYLLHQSGTLLTDPKSLMKSLHVEPVPPLPVVPRPPHHHETQSPPPASAHSQSCC